MAISFASVVSLLFFVDATSAITIVNQRFLNKPSKALGVSRVIRWIISFASSQSFAKIVIFAFSNSGIIFDCLNPNATFLKCFARVQFSLIIPHKEVRIDLASSATLRSMRSVSSIHLNAHFNVFPTLSPHHMEAEEESAFSIIRTTHSFHFIPPDFSISTRADLIIQDSKVLPEYCVCKEVNPFLIVSKESSGEFLITSTIRIFTSISHTTFLKSSANHFV